MATRKNPYMQRFRQTAIQRFEDARVLLRAGRTTGAMYLAGYSVECILKALLLSALSEPESVVMVKYFRGTIGHDYGMVKSFRGTIGHDYGWLRDQYLMSGGAASPKEISRAFVLVGAWSTDIRYEPGAKPAKIAGDFLAETERIIEWAEGRL